ncbi:MAG: phosphoglycolate phosphatase [Melioribacteraceae bacterium]|nr:MAG: phosphoglycolate phosphatase [Melioribacteraceae bacterium]
MKNFKAIVFDLDGTLTQSDETIIETTIHTLKEMELYKPFNVHILKGMIGHHFKEIFDEIDIFVPDMEEFINVFKGNYFGFIDKTKLYPGVFELLNKISESEIKLGLLTTKGQVQAEKIMHHFSIYDFFDIIVGRVPGVAIKPSPEPLIKIANEFNLKTTDLVMVGDTEMDVLCAQNAGAEAWAVTYGYRSSDVLSELKPDKLITDFSEINEMVFG